MSAQSQDGRVVKGRNKFGSNIWRMGCPVSRFDNTSQKRFFDQISSLAFATAARACSLKTQFRISGRRFAGSRAADDRKTSSPASIAIPIALATAIGALISPALQYFGHEHEMNVKMVELGVGILRTEATDDSTVMRSWAIDTIERSTGQKFSAEERASLLHKALPIVTNSAFSLEQQRAIDAIRVEPIDAFLDRAKRLQK